MTKLNNELLPSANKKRKKTKYQQAHLTSKRTVVFTLSQYFMIFYPTIGWRNLKCQHFTWKQTCILISEHFVLAIFLPLLLCCIPFHCILTVNYYFSAIFIINFLLVVRSNVMPLHKKRTHSMESNASYSLFHSEFVMCELIFITKIHLKG